MGGVHISTQYTVPSAISHTIAVECDVTAEEAKCLKNTHGANASPYSLLHSLRNLDPGSLIVPGYSQVVTSHKQETVLVPLLPRSVDHSKITTEKSLRHIDGLRRLKPLQYIGWNRPIHLAA